MLDTALEDEQAKDRTCWDQPTSSHYWTGAQGAHRNPQPDRTGTWRWQLLGTSIMLKPKPDNTDRPLGLLPMMVRLGEKIRPRPSPPSSSPPPSSMQASCRKRAGSWDQAIEKSPALRCALIRCATTEAAAECGMDASLSMVDLEKFCNTIRIDHLVNMALSLRAPARILLVDLMAYLAPRTIQHFGSRIGMAQPRGQHCPGISRLGQLGPHVAI